VRAISTPEFKAMLERDMVSNMFTVGKRDLMNIKVVKSLTFEGTTYLLESDGYMPRALLRYMKHLID
jgi:hypothetical protein